MKVRIVPPNRGSSGARQLSRAMRIKRLRLVHTRFRPRPTDVLLNWGNPSPPFAGVGGLRWVNDPDCVAAAINKAVAVRMFDQGEVPQPEWTNDRRVALDWLSDGEKVVARTMLRGSGGRGIVLAEAADELPEARLFTKYIKKRHEYRIHILHGDVIDVQMKRRRTGFEERNNQIRNHGNGWVYCRESIIEPPSSVLDAAARAVAALRLDFGAADVGYNEHRQQPTVYEVNTAPGLEGSTLLSYRDNLARYINGLR